MSAREWSCPCGVETTTGADGFGPNSLIRWITEATKARQICQTRQSMATPNLIQNKNSFPWDPRFRQLRRSCLRKRKPVGVPALAVISQPLLSPRAVEVNGERERRVLELLPLVRRMALKMRRSLPAHVELDDLVGEGVLGLLDAAGRFDVTKRVKIESYARHRIRGAILDGLRTLDTASRDLRKKNKKMEGALRDLQSKLGRSAEDEEIARTLGVSLKEWHRSIQELQGAGVDWLHPMQSMTFRQVNEENLVAPNQESQFDSCYRRERRDIVNRALACLSERERKIVVLYHSREMTMKQIGSKLRIDESRVSQLHSAAVARLRLSVKAILERPRTVPSSPPASLSSPLIEGRSFL
jgi:RNA polymerase sigma factor FliA